MLNLDDEQDKLKPWWFTVHEAHGDVPAVRVLFEPIGRIALRAARRAAGGVYAQADLPEDENASVPSDLIEAAGDAMSEALLLAGIKDWEGVGNASGDPVAVTPERLALFLADPLRFEKLDAAYVRPWVMADLEKNGLSPLLNGTSAGAGRTTAKKSARRTALGAAKQNRRKTKKAALTTSMSAETTAGLASGT